MHSNSLLESIPEKLCRTCKFRIALLCNPASERRVGSSDRGNQREKKKVFLSDLFFLFSDWIRCIPPTPRWGKGRVATLGARVSSTHAGIPAGGPVSREPGSTKGGPNYSGLESQYR